MPLYKYQNTSFTGDSTITPKFTIPRGEIIIGISIHVKYDGVIINNCPFLVLEDSMTSKFTIESEDLDSLFDVWDGGTFQMSITDTYGSTNEITVKVITLNAKSRRLLNITGFRNKGHYNYMVGGCP